MNISSLVIEFRHGIKDDTLITLIKGQKLVISKLNKEFSNVFFLLLPLNDRYFMFVGIGVILSQIFGWACPKHKCIIFILHMVYFICILCKQFFLCIICTLCTSLAFVSSLSSLSFLSTLSSISLLFRY